MSTPPLEVALVNLMPDAAFVATERQFSTLLQAGAAAIGRTVELSLHTLEGDPRGSRITTEVAERYEPLAERRSRPLDAVVVTGANPVRAELEDEPFWDALAELLLWAVEHTSGLLLSCLAAHAGLAVFDGLPRQRLEAKCTGVFAQTASPGHPLAAALPEPLVLPHSRWNDVDQRLLDDAGWDVALGGPRTGWAVATKSLGRAEVTVVQGHPEYDAGSLLAEYQRDARRYVTGEQEQLPPLPERCLGDGESPVLHALQDSLAAGRRSSEEFAAVSFAALAEQASAPWQPAASKLYGHWLAGVASRSGTAHAG